MTTIEGSKRRVFTNAGVPTDGVNGTYANECIKGDLLIDTTNGTLYQNTNTAASPTWTEKASSGAALGATGAMAASGTSTANSAGVAATAAPIDHVHAIGDHDHSAATKGNNLGAVTIASGTVSGALSVGGDLTVTGTITGTIASASWATPTFTGATTMNGAVSINAAVTVAASTLVTMTGADDFTVLGVTAGDIVLSNGSLSVTNAGDTGVIVLIDNSSGNIANGSGMLKLDMGGDGAAGSSMIRLEPTGTPAEASYGIQFVGATKTMQAMNIDCDAATNPAVLINGGGNQADNNAVLKVTADGTLANGAAIVNITGSTAAGGATAYGLIINCNAVNLEGLSVEAGLVKFAERVDHADGAAATPSIAFTSSTTTGLFYAATYIGLSVSGALVAQVLATGVTLNTDLDLILQGAGYIDVGATGYLEFGAAPSASGTIRLENATAIAWRNQAGGGDITALAVNAVDDVEIGADLQMQGNTVYGDDASGGNLILASTLHATKGYVTIPTGHEGLKIGGTADRAGTVGDNALHIFNGAAAPAGALANGVSIYSEGGECKVLDATGNSTTLSPHTADGDYIIHSYSAEKEETVTIHLEKMLKALAKNDKTLAKYIEVTDGQLKKAKNIK